jgi:protein-S-isoprenylcysteine O-methyltransferase Ste14
MEIRWYTARSPFYATRLQWFAGLTEIATILAWNNPSSPISKALLSMLLLKTGKPEQLRLSTFTTIGVCMMVIGTLIRITTFRYLGKLFRFEASIQKDHQLITSGPYSIVRHPSYTGLLLTHSGWFLWQFGRGSWVRESGLWNTAAGKVIVLSFATVMIIGTLYLTLGRMAKEDEALRKEFGKKWDEWASRVPYCVIPGIW